MLLFIIFVKTNLFMLILLSETIAIEKALSETITKEMLARVCVFYPWAKLYIFAKNIN